ncbi:hypothetical protein MLP_22900 [Microlunatus phosphovorus NM-1]|uniref:Pvc16 N-terminal domain-containing protein n=1 Tax=Microlunatus phosphovorus (strain ATCC 700054 / DSM 10555 / JCM 9379 / NBRC 101784 / NCIMB 13414 / VKM Ac-1990 / NM-1) TaxID=1032480 RepID=F5XET8_MICPN|nr:DUF4255 domain-containing protein [Microlunatus phosphovorus]BAK35304.1 hypothetical protein MLP_22900 [Microlunatus phosphovorus NM-1]
MASYQAIAAVAEAVKRLLEQSWVQTPDGLRPQFAVYNGAEFDSPMATGISVFVYQVTIDATQRTLPASGPGRRRPLPVDVALLLTAWAPSAASEHTLLGFAMRTLADHPVLSSGFLNAGTQGVFGADETVEVVAGQLSNDEIFQLWQALPGNLQLSVPYLAKVVRIESDVAPSGRPVLVREFDMAEGLQ